MSPEMGFEDSRAPAILSLFFQLLLEVQMTSSQLLLWLSCLHPAACVSPSCYLTFRTTIPNKLCLLHIALVTLFHCRNRKITNTIYISRSHPTIEGCQGKNISRNSSRNQQGTLFAGSFSDFAFASFPVQLRTTYQGMPPPMG